MAACHRTQTHLCEWSARSPVRGGVALWSKVGQERDSVDGPHEYPTEVGSCCAADPCEDRHRARARRSSTVRVEAGDCRRGSWIRCALAETGIGRRGRSTKQPDRTAGWERVHRLEAFSAARDSCDRDRTTSEACDAAFATSSVHARAQRTPVRGATATWSWPVGRDRCDRDRIDSDGARCRHGTACRQCACRDRIVGHGRSRSNPRSGYEPAKFERQAA